MRLRDLSVGQRFRFDCPEYSNGDRVYEYRGNGWYSGEIGGGGPWHGANVSVVICCDTVRCVVACRDANGAPCLVGVTVIAPENWRHNGEHYDLASSLVRHQGYEVPVCPIVFDEEDGCRSLFDWPTVEVGEAHEIK